MAKLNRADDNVPNVNEVDETAEFIESMKNKNTKRKTASDCNIFTNWLTANNKHRKMEEIPVFELDKLLALFFMKVTKSDETPYEPGTVKAFQSNSVALIHTGWLNNSLHFVARSREEHATLRWGDIERKATSTGEKYLEHTERQIKTRTGATTHTRSFQAKMFEDKGTYMG
ncbi:unnamed protein product [Mytilus edulis]|uniref:Uncharacterized protein n=1 Tax=Mytilus edulis TaxID=6550 RepID=A0A8S3VBA4_MYTED|nr:unnamed protein product [Mytilus edulis]